jgi:hypothetical protein
MAEVVKESVKEALWCKRCQRGMTGIEEAINSNEGDDCPICVDMARHGNIAENSIGVLKKASTAVKEHEELVRIRKREKELKMHRGIKGTDDLIKEAKAEQRAEIDVLKAQIDELKKLVSSKTK